MTKWLISAFASAVLGLSVFAGGFDYAATAKPIRQSDREKACQYCYDRCGKFNPICRTHCQTRSGCPAPTSGTKSAQ